MNFLALQPLTPEYLTEVVKLDQRCFGGLWTLNGYQREIESPNSDLLILQKLPANPAPQSEDGATALQAELIGLACAWAILDEAHITLLAVDPVYQRQGLGQVLLYALLVLARQRELEWATLEVRASNQTAIALYKKFGFETVGQRRGYYQDNQEDALILWRKGLQRPEFRTDLKQWQQELGHRLQQSHWHLSTFPDKGWNPSALFKSPSSLLT